MGSFVSSVEDAVDSIVVGLTVSNNSIMKFMLPVLALAAATTGAPIQDASDLLPAGGLQDASSLLPAGGLLPASSLLPAGGLQPASFLLPAGGLCGPSGECIQG